MNYHVITIFPQMLDSYLSESIIARAIKNKLIKVKAYSLRDYTTDKHKRVDGRPFGGGPGMIMWIDPIINCFDKIKKDIGKRVVKEKRNKKAKILVVNFSPGGEKFNNELANKVSQKYTDVVFICGRYEGVDSRVVEILKATEWSVGDYVLTGGELPAMVCIDSISRQVVGVLNDQDSLEENRISSHKMYARPEVYKRKITIVKNDKKVTRIKNYRAPKVLLSGNHKLIDEWRKEN